mgnify:CR=1 FL=1
MSRSLKDKVVLITGASSGFGARAAHLFAQDGAKVVLAARRLDRLQKLVDEIQAEGGEALAVPVDVANRAEIRIMVETTLDLYGRIDVLFNNAGFGRLNWLEKLDDGRDIQTQIDVNLTGLIQVTRAVLPQMLKQGSGHIINMSSVAGWLAPPLYTIYSATKFGVRGFTVALRREVKHLGIEVSGIYPGPAVTEFSQHTGKNEVKSSSLSTPSWMEMSAEFVAKKTVQLAKQPRRAMILPWWFAIVIWLDNHFPAISDFFQSQFAKKYHQ